VAATAGGRSTDFRDALSYARLPGSMGERDSFGQAVEARSSRMWSVAAWAAVLPISIGVALLAEAARLPVIAAAAVVVMSLRASAEAAKRIRPYDHDHPAFDVFWPRACVVVAGLFGLLAAIAAADASGVRLGGHVVLVAGPGAAMLIARHLFGVEEDEPLVFDSGEPESGWDAIPRGDRVDEQRRDLPPRTMLPPRI
jgi:hypothetical protein